MQLSCQEINCDLTKLQQSLLKSTCGKWIVSWREKAVVCSTVIITIDPLRPLIVFGLKCGHSGSNGKSPEYDFTQTLMLSKTMLRRSCGDTVKRMHHCRRNIFSSSAGIKVYLWLFHPAQHQGNRILSCFTLNATLTLRGYTEANTKYSGEITVYYPVRSLMPKG